MSSSVSCDPDDGLALFVVPPKSSQGGGTDEEDYAGRQSGQQLVRYTRIAVFNPTPTAVRVIALGISVVDKSAARLEKQESNEEEIEQYQIPQD